MLTRVFHLTTRIVLVAVVAAVASALAHSAFHSLPSLDFIALYAAARLFVTGRGADVLDSGVILAVEREVAPERVALLPFVHPPATAALLAPLALLPFPVAYGAMVALTLACLAASAYILRPLVAPRERPALIALALLAPPSAVAALQGQTTALALLLVALAWRKDGALAGFLLGLGALRPQTLPLFALAALTDRGRAVGFVAGAGVVVLASAAVVGPGGLARYATLLFEAGGWSLTGEYGLLGAVGWTGIALRLSAPLAGIALAGASFIVGAAGVARARDDARIAVAASWALLASPHALIYDVVLAYPAVGRLASTRGSALLWCGAGVLAAAGQLAGVPLLTIWILGVAVASIVMPVRESLR